MKKVKLSELKFGPIRQEILPEGFIVRVQKYKETLKEVEGTSLEETISNFQRDLDPLKELTIWENIAQVYEDAVNNNPIWTLDDKKELFLILLRKSMGLD